MRQFLLCSAAFGALLLSACNGAGGDAKGKEDPATFLASAEKELSDFSDYAARVAWVNANFITDDTDWLNARAGSEGTLLSVRLANATKQFEGATLTPTSSAR